MLSIDRLDSDLIGKLMINARAGIADLASQLGIARNTALTRLRRLEQTGAVTGFRPTVGLEAIGVPIGAHVAVELDQRRLGQVVDDLARIPPVLEINIQAGREDLLVRIAARTHSELQEVISAIIETPGVRRTATTLIVSTPLEYRVQPLLDHITREAGFGRSTPAPTPVPTAGSLFE